MPALASSKDGEYTATPVVGQVNNYSSLQLSLSPEEVSSVFTVPLTTLIDPANHGYTQFRPVSSTLIGRGLTRLGSHWSRASECWWRHQSYAIKK